MDTRKIIPIDPTDITQISLEDLLTKRDRRESLTAHLSDLWERSSDDKSKQALKDYWDSKTKLFQIQREIDRRK
jgi:hypothetical protein